MKGESQAAHLKEMMQNHPLCHTYVLSIPPVEIKRSIVKKLSPGDILLTGSEALKFLFWEDDQPVAEGKLRGCKKFIDIEKHEDLSTYKGHSKKYDILLCLFGTISSKAISNIEKIDISSLDITTTVLFVNDKKIADGKLIRVKNEIGIEITKVEK